jgi:transcriptional regulator with GAF, ATPase, and Fis domain
VIVPPDLGTAVLADLVASLAAIGRSMQEEFDPRRFLQEFSARIQRLVPHDRLVACVLDEGARTFRVFAEHVERGPFLHDQHYTTDFAPPARYLVEDFGARSAFAGEPLLVADYRDDPRYRRANDFERRLFAAGFRAGLLVPLSSGARVIGILAAHSFTPGSYTETHRGVAERVAALIAPFIENIVLLQRERHRRRRLAALQGLAPVLGASLNVREVFHKLADAVRPVLEFDVMGVALISSSGRDLEFLAEVDNGLGVGVETPPRVPLEHFSFGAKVEAGETFLIHDAALELDPARPGDRRIINAGARASLAVPLGFGDRVGGALYFGKAKPHWFETSDAEIAAAIAVQVVAAIQHQRLGEDQRRLVAAEGRTRHLEERLERLRSELGERHGFDRVIGRSSALKETLAAAAKVAPTETTVLITGESGTGKEVLARAIHHASLRADGPFVAINCAALPETLLESELFGHERGAFTGADRQKRGRFELAAGGTLFLDEIGELSPAVQVKLLRVLQEREFERLGGTTTLRADVRIIAATNRDLERAVEAGRFRDDLYYRLNVFSIRIPPLQGRGDDVLLLADHFGRGLAERMGKGGVQFSREAREVLLAHSWPGNVRELQNAIERALILTDGGLITGAQLGIAPRRERSTRERPRQEGDASGEVSGARGPRLSLAEWEKQIISDALASARGNKSEAARLLGLTRSQLYTRLKRFGLAPEG